MTVERAILCGPVHPDQLPVQDPRPLWLHQWGPLRNVHLTIEDLRRAMWRDLPAVWLDLLDIATYVYVADQAIKRGSLLHANWGEDWRRRLFFRIPVRRPDRWNSPEVRDQLASTLSFLAEDEYIFEFEPLREQPPGPSYFEFSDDAFDGTVDDVVLFSGGLDSLAGAVQEAVCEKRRVLLVHHRSTTKRVPRHQRLLQRLQQYAPQAPPQHIQVRINKAKGLTREFTQRTRSFLFASLGATIAQMVGKPRLRMYENGVISCNLPPSAQVVGARASRTTHPRVLAGFQSLFSTLMGQPFKVENPFRWRTKAQVVEAIAQAGCPELIGLSVSCSRTWGQTRKHSHCGKCSQCIDRRFAVLAAQQERNDSADEYQMDLLTGPRAEGHPRTMLAVYVAAAMQIHRMQCWQFFRRYGEVSRLLPYLEDSPDVVAMKVFELYRQHATEVVDVVDRAIAPYASALQRRRLPPSCLIRLVCDESPLGEIPSANTSGEHSLSTANVFRWQGKAWQVQFGRGRSWILLPSKGATYLHALLSQPGQAISASDLAFRAAKTATQFAQGSAGESVDPETLAAYRVRYEDLQEALEKARADNDGAAVERAQTDLAWLADELRRHQGIGGRLRTVADDRERVRKAVGNALRRVRKQIGEEDQALAKHLAGGALKCGQHLCYAPGEGVQWKT